MLRARGIEDSAAHRGQHRREDARDRAVADEADHAPAEFAESVLQRGRGRPRRRRAKPRRVAEGGAASRASAAARVRRPRAELVPGRLQTAMPRAAAAARSIVFTPVADLLDQPQARRGGDRRGGDGRQHVPDHVGLRHRRRGIRPAGQRSSRAFPRQRARRAEPASAGPGGVVEQRCSRLEALGLSRCHAIGRARRRRRSVRPGRALPRSRSASFHFAMRSLRANEPTLSWPSPQPTARWTMVVSSVSPERAETMPREAARPRRRPRLRRLGQRAALVRLEQHRVRRPGRRRLRARARRR